MKIKRLLLFFLAAFAFYPSSVIFADQCASDCSSPDAVALAQCLIECEAK
jgi:hypothetical protein